MNVAFLGLGTMGAPMAANILRRGHALAVWNRSPHRAAPLVEAGARAASTPADAVRDAEVIVLMLADPPAVRAVLDGADGILAGLRPGALVVDMSTVDPATARAVDAEVRAHGGRFVDAPVSGTRKPAVDGKLVIMCGGDPADVERARPVLEAMGRVIAVGGVGQGMAMKLVLNGLGAHMMTGFAAMMVLGVAQGLAPAAMLEVISGGAFSSPLYAGKGPRIFARDFQPDFTLALMHKDQTLVLETAASLGYQMPTLAAIRDVLKEGIDAGLGDGDLSGVIRLFEAWAKVEVKA
ncbi:MAG: 2-hydroxy-3-oxopropionate reductase [Myxococcales bacterium]|nr:2-hydroxy-3-oxopropionate reductase [Myxococcales bacterium]